MGAKTVKEYTDGKLKWLLAQAEHPQKACLAKLRKGVGKIPGELPELWGILLDKLPEELEGASGEPSKAEWAIYLSLTLYALHQQGCALPAQNMNKYGSTLGGAVRRLVEEDVDAPAETSATKRLNRLATSMNMQEASNHLRGIVQMLRAKGIELDYVQLADDLYQFQFPDQATRVKLRWGQDFYRNLDETKTDGKKNGKGE